MINYLREFEEQITGRSIISRLEILSALCNDQDGDAELYIKLHKGRFVFDRSAGVWYEFAGHYWTVDIVGNSLRAIESVIELYGNEASGQGALQAEAVKQGNEVSAKKHEKECKALLKRVHELHSLQRKKNVLELAGTGEHGLCIRGNEWDKDPWLFGCKNGVIDLRTGQFRQGRPEDYIRAVSNVEYLGIDTPCPRWETTLATIFDSCKPIIDYFRRLIGYCMTGSTDEHIIAILWGAGRNGKSLLLKVIKNILGTCAGDIESALLMKQRFRRGSGGPTSDIMALQGKRLVVASESPDGARIDEEKIKYLTGGDSLTGRQVYGRHQVSFHPTHKTMLLTNHKPHIDPSDYALVKRLHLVPFTRAFVTDPVKHNEFKADPHLAEKVLVEASGILSWMVCGCLEWQRQGLNPPKEIRAAVRDYLQEEDLIQRFLDEECEIRPDLMSKASDLYSWYADWCNRNNLHPVTGTMFGRKMGERFERGTTTNNSIEYRGVGRASCFDDPG